MAYRRARLGGLWPPLAFSIGGRIKTTADDISLPKEKSPAPFGSGGALLLIQTFLQQSCALYTTLMAQEGHRAAQ